MKVLVTGASGLIGQGVARALKRRGHQAVGVFHSPANEAKVRATGAQPLQLDLNSPSLAEAAQGCEAIVHCAQVEYYTKRLSTGFVSKAGAVDLAWTRRLLEAGKGTAKTFVYTSGAWVYGPTQDAVVDETHPINCYAAAAFKPEGERIALEEAKRLGYASAAVIRPGTVYGLGSAFETFFLKPMRRGKKATLIGSGLNSISFIHADDLGEMYALAVEKNASFEAFNAGDDEPVEVKTAITYLAEKMGAPPPGNAPPFIVGLFIGHAIKPLTQSLKITSAKAKRLLGWKPQYPTYREGMAAVAAQAKA